MGAIVRKVATIVDDARGIVFNRMLGLMKPISPKLYYPCLGRLV